MMEARTRGEAQALGTAATVGMILLLLIAYRRVGSIVLSALPLASAGLAGLAAVSALFGTVHGITLAFGFTLIGVAQDYPMHLLSHRRPDRNAVAIARELWPTLATGVASTCIAYSRSCSPASSASRSSPASPWPALAVAGLTTRFCCRALMDARPARFRRLRMLERCGTRSRGCRGRAGRRWRSPLARRSRRARAAAPLGKRSRAAHAGAAELLLQDQQLRAELGTPDVRYLLVVDATRQRAGAANARSARPALQELVDAARSPATTTPRATCPPPRRSSGARQRCLSGRAAGRSHGAGRHPVSLRRVRAVRRGRRTRARAAAADDRALARTPLGAQLEMLLHERERRHDGARDLQRRARRRGAARFARTPATTSRCSISRRRRKTLVATSARAFSGASQSPRCCSSPSSHSRCAAASV